MQQTVIIADDAQFMRLMLKDILEEMDLTVVAEGYTASESEKVQKDLEKVKKILIAENNKYKWNSFIFQNILNLSLSKFNGDVAH
mgnify:CR=1 FL=1